jgi:hypothetical protein
MTSNCHRVNNMFSTKAGKPHSAIKKMVANVYSKSFISSSPAVKSQTAAILYDRLLPILADLAEGDEPTEVVELYFGLTMDFISAFLFGLRCSSNFLADNDLKKRFLQHWENIKENSFWVNSASYVAQFPLMDILDIGATRSSKTWPNVRYQFQYPRFRRRC